MSNLANYFISRFEKDKQTTAFKVGDVICEKDVSNPDEVLDVLFILQADYGDPKAEDPEDYQTYYKFYSFNENDIWDHEPLDSGRVIYYEKCN